MAPFWPLACGYTAGERPPAVIGRGVADVDLAARDVESPAVERRGFRQPVIAVLGCADRAPSAAVVNRPKSIRCRRCVRPAAADLSSAETPAACRETRPSGSRRPPTCHSSTVSSSSGTPRADTPALLNSNVEAPESAPARCRKQGPHGGSCISHIRGHRDRVHTAMCLRSCDRLLQRPPARRPASATE